MLMAKRDTFRKYLESSAAILVISTTTTISKREPTESLEQIIRVFRGFCP